MLPTNYVKTTLAAGILVLVARGPDAVGVGAAAPPGTGVFTACPQGWHLLGNTCYFRGRAKTGLSVRKEFS